MFEIGTHVTYHGSFREYDGCEFVVTGVDTERASQDPEHYPDGYAYVLTAVCTEHRERPVELWNVRVTSFTAL